MRLELAGSIRDLDLFNRTVDSVLRGCDLVKPKVAYLYPPKYLNAKDWGRSISLEPSAYDTHSMKRPKLRRFIKNWKSSRRSAAVRAHEDGQHSKISGRGFRRRSCDFRKCRDLNYRAGVKHGL